MDVSYSKLWKRMIDKGMNKTRLKDLSGVSTNVIAKLGKSESVPVEALVKICRVLDCDIGDVVEICAGKEPEARA